MAPGQSPFAVWCSAKRSSVKLGLTCQLGKLAEGAHPENPDLEDDSPAPRVGWQRPASLQTRETVRVRNVTSVQSDRASTDAFPERPHVWGAVHLLPINQGNTVRSPVVPPPVVASFAPTSSAHHASLPMWPSSRLLWPSSRSVRTVVVLGRRGPTCSCESWTWHLE